MLNPCPFFQLPVSQGENSSLVVSSHQSYEAENRWNRVSLELVDSVNLGSAAVVFFFIFFFFFCDFPSFQRLMHQSARHCGTTNPHDFISLGNEVRVIFHSDTTGVARGFSLMYTLASE